MKRFALPALLVLGVLLVPAMTVQAVPLPFGGTVVPTAAPGILTVVGETKLGDTGVVNMSTSVWTGTVIAQVYSNPGGTLDFVYQFHNNTGSSEALGRIAGGSFGASFTTDVFYDATSPSLLGVSTPITGGLTPTDANRGTCPTCVVVGFDFINTPTKVLAGETSPILLVRTNATHFTTGTLAVIDSQSFNGTAFQPTAVPEPASLLLIGAGLAGLGLILRRRKSS